MKFRKILAMCLAGIVSISTIDVLASHEEFEGHVFEFDCDEWTIIEDICENSGEDENSVYIQEFIDFEEEYNAAVMNNNILPIDGTEDSGSPGTSTPITTFPDWNWDDGNVFRANVPNVAGYMPNYAFTSLNFSMYADMGVNGCEAIPALGTYKVNDDGTITCVDTATLAKIEGTENDYALKNHKINTQRNSRYIFVLAAGKNWDMAYFKVSFTDMSDVLSVLEEAN